MGAGRVCGMCGARSKGLKTEGSRAGYMAVGTKWAVWFKEGWGPSLLLPAFVLASLCPRAQTGEPGGGGATCRCTPASQLVTEGATPPARPPEPPL
eukprot:309662-Chlamydomonas_euryale.AAC.1